MTDFFEPNTTYALDALYRAPEVLPEFQCVAVCEHPSKGQLRAFGFRRSGRFFPWVSTALTVDDWDRGWIEVPQAAEPAATSA